MNRKNNSPNPGFGAGTRTGLSSQAAPSAAGSPSLFGLISKVNQGILKEPAKPKGILKNSSKPGAVVPTSTSQTEAGKQKHDAFLEAKSKIEQIQKGLWKPSEQRSPATSSANTEPETVFKVPMVIPTLKSTKRSAQKKSGKINSKSSTPVVGGVLSQPEAIDRDSTDSDQNVPVKTDVSHITPTVINLVDYDDDDEAGSEAAEQSSRKYTEHKALKELDMYSARKRDDQDNSNNTKTDNKLDKGYYSRGDSDEERTYSSRSKSYSPERSRLKDYSPESERYRGSDRYARSGYRHTRSPSPDVYIRNLSPPMDMSRYSRYPAYHSSGYNAGALDQPYRLGYDSYGVQSMHDSSRQMDGYYSGSGNYRGGSPPYYNSPYQSGDRASSPGFNARKYTSTVYGRSTSSIYESQKIYDPYYSDSSRQMGYDRGVEKSDIDNRRREYEREHERGYSNRETEQRYSDYRYDSKDYNRRGDDYKSRHSDTGRDSQSYGERERNRDREREIDREKERDRNMQRERDNERERGRNSERDRDHREKRSSTRKRGKGRDKHEPGKEDTRERSKISFAITSKTGVGGQAMDRLEEFDDSSSFESGDENEGEGEKIEKSPEFVRWDEYEDETEDKNEAKITEKEKEKTYTDELYEDYLFSDRYMKDDDAESIIGVRDPRKSETKDASSNKAETKTGEPAVGFRCEDCDVTCADKFVYEVHLLGVKHTNTLQKKADEALKSRNAPTSTGRKSRFATDSSGKPVVIGCIQPPGVAAVVPASVKPVVSQPLIPQVGPHSNLIPPAVSLPTRPDFSKPPPSLTVPRPDFTKPPPSLSAGPSPSVRQPLLPTPVLSRPPPSQPDLVLPGLKPPTVPPPRFSGPPPAVRPSFPTSGFVQPTVLRPGITQQVASHQSIPQPVISQQSILRPAIPQMSVPKPVASQQAMPQPLMSLTIPRPVISQQIVSQPGVGGQIIAQQVVPLPIVSQQAVRILPSTQPTGTLQARSQSHNEAEHIKTRFDAERLEEPRKNDDAPQSYKSNSRHGIHVTVPKPLGPLQASRIQTRCVTLTWEFLSEEEEEMVDRYVVEYRNARETHWVTVANTTDHKYIVDGLQENTDYLFRVVAMCGLEKSEYLESILITTAKRGDSPRRRSRDRDTKWSRQSDRTRSYGRLRSRSRSPERRRSRSADRKRSRSPERRRSRSSERQTTRETKRRDSAEKRKEHPKSDNQSRERTEKVDKKPDLDASVLEIKLKTYAEKEFSKNKLGSAVNQGSKTKQNVDCHFYQMFKKYPEEPMLGLDYLYEIQSYNPLIPPYYKCKLCKQSGSGEIMIRHILGYAHRMAIIKQHNPVLSESIGMLYARKQKLAKVLKESMIIEDNIGRGAINVMRMLNPEDQDGKVIFEEPIPVQAPPMTRPKYEEPDNDEELDPQDSEFMKLYNAAVEAEALPDKAIIGLKYVQELIHPDNSELPLYRCNLCKCLLRHGTILFHLIGKKHRSQYVKKHYPTQFESSSKSSNFKRGLPELAAEIEQKEGIGMVQITKCKSTRAWNQKNKNSADPSANQTNQDSTDTSKTGDGSTNKGIKFGIKKPEEQTTAIKQTNILEEETKQSSKEILDWTTENENLQTKIQNQSIIKSSRKSRFMTVYGLSLKKFSVIGTQWITEFQKPDPKAEPWFMCFMCQQKIQWKSIMDHVTSTAHRFNYLKTAHKDMSKTLFEQIGSSRLGMKHLVDEFSQKVIRMEGYQTEMEVMIELNINTEALKSVMKVKDGSKALSASTTSVSPSTNEIHLASRAGPNSIQPLFESTSTIQQSSIPPLIPPASSSQQTSIPSLLSTNILPSQKFKQSHSSVGDISQFTSDDSASAYDSVIQKQAGKVLTQQILAAMHFPQPETHVQSHNNLNEDFVIPDNHNSKDFRKRSSSVERYQDVSKRFKSSTDQFSSEDGFQVDKADMYGNHEKSHKSKSPPSRSQRSKERETNRDLGRSRRSRDDGRSRRSRERDKSSAERNPRDRERKGRYPDRQSITESSGRSNRERRKRSSSRDKHVRSSSRERRGRYVDDRDDARDGPRERTQKSRFSDIESDRASDTDKGNTKVRPSVRTRPSRFSDPDPGDFSVNESDINLQVTANQSESGRVVRRVSPSGGRRVTLQENDEFDLDNEDNLEGDYGSDQFDDEILEGDGSFTSEVNLEEEFEQIDEDISNETRADIDREREFTGNKLNIVGNIRGRGRDFTGLGSFRNNFGGLKASVNEVNLMPNQGLMQGNLRGNMTMGMMGVGRGMHAVGGDQGSLLGMPKREFNRRQGGMSNLGAIGAGQESYFMQDNMPDPTQEEIDQLMQRAPDPTREEIDQLMQRAKSLMNVIEKMDNSDMVDQNMGAGPSGMMQMNMLNNMGQGPNMLMGQMSNRGFISGSRGPERGFRGQRGFRGGSMRGNF